MGYAFINFWDVDACKPSENFDSLVLVFLVPLSRMVLEVFAVSSEVCCNPSVGQLRQLSSVRGCRQESLCVELTFQLPG